MIILPRTDTPAARAMAERIRAAIETSDVLEGTGVDLSAVTASIGIATAPHHAADAEGLFRAADAAMYAVKRAGKNGVGLARAA